MRAWTLEANNNMELMELILIITIILQFLECEKKKRESVKYIFIASHIKDLCTKMYSELCIVTII